MGLIFDFRRVLTKFYMTFVARLTQRSTTFVRTAPSVGKTTTLFLRPGGMRARAFNPPRPLGGRSALNRNSRTCKLQSLSPPRTLCRAIPQNNPWTTIGHQTSDVCPLFSVPRKRLDFSSAQRPKISKIRPKGAQGIDFS